MTDNERRQAGQWVLERNLAWIAAAEVKVGVIVAIDTAMLGALGAAFSTAAAAALVPWTYVWLSGAVVALLAGIFCAAMAVLPRVNGPAKSLVFFGPISKLNQGDYADKLLKASDTQLLEDLAAQIHRNAEIANEKFAWVGLSMRWSFFALLPWFMAVVTLMKKQ